MTLITVDLSRLEARLAELGDKAEEAARPAAQAGAQVVYDQVKANVAALGRVTGNLDRSIYQVFRDKESAEGCAVYRISWNHQKAPHGHLVEFGHIQRYKYFKGEDGRIRPMVRPGMEGARKPSRNAPQSVKDAYYVPLATPIQVPAKAFLRRATSSFERAAEAAEKVLIEAMHGDA